MTALTLQHSFLRFLSLALAMSAVILLPGQQVFKTFVSVIGFTHYFVSLWYGRHHAIAALKNSRGLSMSVALLAAGYALYHIKFPLVIYFAVHHAFNEVYLLDRTVAGLRSRPWAIYRVSAVSMHFFIFCAILHRNASFAQLPVWVYWTGIGLSLIGYLYGLSRVAPLADQKVLPSVILFDSLAVLLAGLALIWRITFLQVLCYHFFYWTFFPIRKMISGPRFNLAGYAALTLGSLLVFYVLSPFGHFRSPEAIKVFSEQFILWGYVHITLSFAMSLAQPSWINQMFRPVPRSQVVAP
jgi:hypothetical protein